MNKFFDDNFTEEEIELLNHKAKSRMEQDEILAELERRIIK